MSASPSLAGALRAEISGFEEYLTEVNVTSPTGIQEINRLYGTKLEADVIDFVEKKCPRRAGK